ncbi:MAG: hypothetical protein ACI30W_06765 [Muribaculaceae bacterium]
MTITISLQTIIDGVYAASALAHRRADSLPLMLRRGHEPALRRLAIDAVALQALHLSSVITGITLPSVTDPDAYDVTLDIVCSGDCSAELLASTISAGVTQRLLSLSYTDDDSDRSAGYAALAVQSADLATALARAAPSVTPRIKPYF